MKKIISIMLLMVMLSGCATKGGWPCFAWQKNTDQKNEAWAEKQIKANKSEEDQKSADTVIRLQYQLQTNAFYEKIKTREGTNFLGVYLGMFAIYVPKDNSVIMASATSGEFLRWIPKQEFEDVYVNKIKPEYHSK